MKIADLNRVMQTIAPLAAAEPWDNVGLLVGDPAAAVTRVLLTIDYSPAVAAEAMSLGCDAVVAYHPPIFSAIKKIVAGSAVFDAIRNGIAIYSPHTALDVAAGGTNDVLADALGLLRRRPLKFAEAKATHVKLVTFVPVDAAAAVRDALFTAGAGAGEIGNYSECSFTSDGTGTFRPGAGANPAIGSIGTRETVAEQRIEMLVPSAKLTAAVTALRASHPYEEPAFDLLTMTPEPATGGMGRVGEFDAPIAVEMLVARLKLKLSIGHVLVAGPIDRPIKTAAVCAGSCGSFLDDAIAAKVDLLVTGELKHHDALKAANAGMTAICTLHSNSERAVLPVLAERLIELLPGVAVDVSRQDRDPFSIE